MKTIEGKKTERGRRDERRNEGNRKKKSKEERKVREKEEEKRNYEDGVYGQIKEVEDKGESHVIIILMTSVSIRKGR